MRWGLLFILLVQIAHAATIENATTTGVIEGREVRINSQYETSSERVEDLYIQLPRDVSSVSASMDGVARDCTIKKSIAFCGKLDNGNHSVLVEYVTSESLGSLSDRDVFRFNEYLPFRTNRHTFVLKLPVGSIIPTEEGKDPTFFLNPKPNEVLSDGQRIIITWKSSNTNAVSISAVIQSLRPVDWKFEGFVIAIAASLGAFGMWYFLIKRRRFEKPKKQKKEKKSKELVPKFIEHEQRVVDLLGKAENKELWQKQILQETKFSKAKLSRIIRNLEQRGVVTKTIFGNTNKISLKK